ncbi:MAG: hypothetical protein KF878_30020 [Planctomycetes bacterium]|nr:hypothetical protein [Planctomycetota bacterium]
MANKSGKNRRGKDAKDAGKSQAKGRGIAAEDLPRRTLEECLKLAEALHNIHADQATWAQLTQDLNVGAASNNTKYLFWSATA